MFMFLRKLPPSGELSIFLREKGYAAQCSPSNGDGRQSPAITQHSTLIFLGRNGPERKFLLFSNLQ
jgi:hypothetical protein